MPYQDLTDSLTAYYPALLLDSVATPRTRELFRSGIAFVTSLLFVPILLGLFFNISLSSHIDRIIQGCFFVGFSLWLSLMLLEACYRSYVHWEFPRGAIPFSYKVAQIVFSTEEDDLTGGFIRSHFGRHALRCAGLDDVALSHFLSTRKEKSHPKRTVFPGNTAILEFQYAKEIYRLDGEFARFLSALSVSEKNFTDAISEALSREEKQYPSFGFWHPETLSRIRVLIRED